MNNKLLLVRPKAYTHESLSGYLLRAAEMNGRQSARVLCTRALETKHYSLVHAGTNTSKTRNLMAVLGLNEIHQKFSNAKYHTDYTIRDVNIPIAVRRAELSAFCPQCLDEVPYWRDIWQTKLYNACSKHHIQILSCCPECKENLGLSRSHLLQCSKCGFDFRNSPREPSCSKFSAKIEQFISEQKSISDFSSLFRSMAKVQIDDDEKAHFMQLYDAEETRHNAILFLAKRVIETAETLHPRIQMVAFSHKVYGSIVNQVFDIVNPHIEKMIFPASSFISLTRPVFVNLLNCKSTAIQDRILTAADISLPSERGLFYVEAHDLMNLLSKGYFNSNGAFTFHDGSVEQQRREYLLSEVATMANHDYQDLIIKARKKQVVAHRKKVKGLLRWIVPHPEIESFLASLKPKIHLRRKYKTLGPIPSIYEMAEEFKIEN